MSISTFAELKTSVGTWLNRADLTSYLADFITMAGHRIYYGSQDPVLPSSPVRTWSMQTRASLSVSNGAAALPTRFLSALVLRGSDGNAYWTIDYLTPSVFSTYTGNTGGVASFYTIQNNQFEFSSSATTSITCDYYQSFADFSGDSDTNALLTAAPALWLQGALLEANIFVGDDEGAKKAHRMYSSVVSGLNNVAKEYGGGSLQVVAR